jgi:hypothetical protein
VCGPACPYGTRNQPHDVPGLSPGPLIFVVIWKKSIRRPSSIHIVWISTSNHKTRYLTPMNYQKRLIYPSVNFEMVFAYVAEWFSHAWCHVNKPMTPPHLAGPNHSFSPARPLASLCRRPPLPAALAMPVTLCSCRRPSARTDDQAGTPLLTRGSLLCVADARHWQTAVLARLPVAFQYRHQRTRPHCRRHEEPATALVLPRDPDGEGVASPLPPCSVEWSSASDELLPPSV